MKFGFIRTAAASVDVSVADCEYNASAIIDAVKKADLNNAEIIVFPELAVTGYTCGDLFNQKSLIDDALIQLLRIVDETKNIDIISVVGIPFEYEQTLYNTAAVIHKGKIIGIVPKTCIPNYNEFYEKRHFTKAFDDIKSVFISGYEIPFGTKLLFCSENKKNFTFAVEICEDLWSVFPPSSFHASAGASIIANPSAGNEITGKDVYRKSLVGGQSARLICGYIYSCAGEGESTTDVVFSGHNIIAENGKIIAEGKRFENQINYADIDTDFIASERRKNTTYNVNSTGYKKIYFSMEETHTMLNRFVDRHPFVPADEKQREKRCEEILSIQSMGLKKRIKHIGCKNVVVGISGGLDSTQALIVAYRAFEMLGLDKKGIITVTMPCFGTTDRTYNNAVNLCRMLGTTLIEINIKESVLKHFEDIGQNPDIHDLTYENSQARERTQILMDIAGKYNGFVVGTGDLSELALGFATYNGDHMSMYGVNASVPKTLIRYLINYFADYYADEKLKGIILDILETPVSPELLPPEQDGTIKQVTEDIVGPYELHDFFLYNMMRMGFEPEKILFLAEHAFKGQYDKDTILKWLKMFYKRFFTQQFKRSCLPDSPKVGSVSLSPRGDWRMPSDANVVSFLKRL